VEQSVKSVKTLKAQGPLKRDHPLPGLGHRKVTLAKTSRSTAHGNGILLRVHSRFSLDCSMKRKHLFTHNKHDYVRSPAVDSLLLYLLKPIDS